MNHKSLLGMFPYQPSAVAVPTVIDGPLPRQAGLWLGRHRDPSAIDAPRKSLRANLHHLPAAHLP